MKIKEAIELINNSDNYYSLLDAEDLLIGCKFRKRQDYCIHKWYMMATDIYKVDDGYIGIKGVVGIKSEIINERCRAKEYEAIQTITYIPKIK